MSDDYVIKFKDDDDDHDSKEERVISATTMGFCTKCKAVGVVDFDGCKVSDVDSKIVTMRTTEIYCSMCKQMTEFVPINPHKEGHRIDTGWLTMKRSQKEIERRYRETLNNPEWKKMKAQMKSQMKKKSRRK